MREKLPPLGWIRSLAEPYLRGFRPVLERKAGLRGYRFLRSAAESKARRARAMSKATPEKPTARLGFFVGYLADAGGLPFLSAQPPECLVFAFVEPVGGADHREQVARPESLVRRTFTYIRWLTHRPPRFEFYEAAPAALVRHSSMREWPRNRRGHFSRNFFIETLAWLVRSGLVRKFLNEPLIGSSRTSKPRKHRPSS